MCTSMSFYYINSLTTPLPCIVSREGDERVGTRVAHDTEFREQRHSAAGGNRLRPRLYNVEVSIQI